MITDDEAWGLEVGTRVFYTKKDGTRIYGEVRSIYPEKRMLSMKPDSTDEEHPAYNQTYRFRRLTIDRGNKTEFFGLQLAPLVVLASSKATPTALQRIFSCGDGLFVTDGKKLILEKIKGLKDGYVRDETLWELTKREIQEKGKYDDTIIYSRKNDQVDEYNEFKRSRGIARIKVNTRMFNRYIRSIPYSTGQYHAKWSDVATVLVNGALEIDVFDKRLELCGAYYGDTKAILKVHGVITASYMLYDLREIVKSIRTKEYELEFMTDGTVVIETEEQLRILYPLEGTVKKTAELRQARGRTKKIKGR